MFGSFASIFPGDWDKWCSDPNWKQHGGESFNEILISQKIATEVVFKRKKIPFRSFEILNRTEESLGELFCFFILETILLGRLFKVDPFDQPSIELVKNETFKILN